MKSGLTTITKLFFDPVMFALIIGGVVLAVIAIVLKVWFERNNNKLLAESGADMEAIKAVSKKKTKKNIILVLLVVLAIIITGIASSGKTPKSKTFCPSCDRNYTDSANKKSISRTNMCKNCYENYKSLEWVLDE